MKNDNKTNILSSSLILVAIAIVSKALGMIREMVFAAELGTTNLSDAYLLGTTLSQIMLVGIAESLFKVYIPMGTSQLVKSKKNLVDYTLEILVKGSLVFGVICVVVMVTSSQTTNLLGFDADATTVEYAKIICRITAIPSIALLITNILQGYLQILGKFWTNVVYPVILNISLILIVLTAPNNATNLGIAYSVGQIVPAFALIFISAFYGLRIHRIKRSGAIRKTLALSVPLFFGGIVSQVNEIVDRSFSATYSVGILTSLRYGKLLETFVVSVIAVPLAQAVFPKIALLFQGSKTKEANSLINSLLIVITYIALPIMVGIFLIGGDLVRVFFMHGNFDNNSAEQTEIAFKCYAFSILPVSFSEILNRAYISKGDTKRPVMFSMISMGTNIFLNYIAVFIMKLPFYSLAITTSIAEAIMSIMYCLFSKKVSVEIKIREKDLLTSLFASALMAIVLFLIKKVDISNLYIRFIVLFIMGIITFFATALILNKKGINSLVSSLRKQEA